MTHGDLARAYKAPVVHHLTTLTSELLITGQVLVGGDVFTLEAPEKQWTGPSLAAMVEKLPAPPVECHAPANRHERRKAARRERLLMKGPRI